MAFLDRPRSLYPSHGLNRPLDLSLTTEDIDGARSRKRSFTTKRCTDPLEPVYKLPSFQPPPILVPPEPVGTLPTNWTADISGSRPRILHRAIQGKISNLDVSDIAGTQSSCCPRKERSVHGSTKTDSLDVYDINAGSYRGHRTRSVNPLDPVYLISNVSNWTSQRAEPSFIGPIEKSRPRQLIPTKSTETRGDVTGSHPQRFVGRLPNSSTGEPKIQLWEKPLPTASVHGSLKKGIVTKRITDPLDPGYHMLDGKVDSACKLLMG